MKIILISPKGPLYRHKGGIFKKSLRYQPLTLTTLAALIPDELNIEVQLIDESIQTIPENLDADIIAMTVITGTANRAYKLAELFKKQGKYVVMGGPHITLLPTEAIKYADTIFTGYAEKTWVTFLKDYQNNCQKKFYKQEMDFSLDNSPFPKRELFKKGSFLTQAVFEATRSCAHSCDFCVAPTAWGNKQYQKPIDTVIEDIKRVGEKRILFIDLNLVSDIKYATELFTKLIPLKVKWFGLSTVLIAHNEGLMELMAKSGCKGLLLGLETVSKASLKDAKKQFNSSVNYHKLISDLHHLGISVQGCFAFGLDSDTKDTFEETIDFVLSAGVDLPRFAILTPFPATPLHLRLERENRIITKDWELYDGQHVVFEPKNMTAKELLFEHERVWKKVYSYPSIFKRLSKSRNFRPLAITSNLGYKFYANNLDKYYNCDTQIKPTIPNPVKYFKK